MQLSNEELHKQYVLCSTVPHFLKRYLLKWSLFCQNFLSYIKCCLLLNATFFSFSFPPLLSSCPFSLLPTFHSLPPLSFLLLCLNTVVWRCNSLPLCVVRIITMELHPLPPLLPPHSPRPFSPIRNAMAFWDDRDPVFPPMNQTTLLTVRAHRRRRRWWKAQFNLLGVNAV